MTFDSNDFCSKKKLNKNRIYTWCTKDNVPCYRKYNCYNGEQNCQYRSIKRLRENREYKWCTKDNVPCYRRYNCYGGEKSCKYGVERDTKEVVLLNSNSAANLIDRGSGASQKISDVLFDNAGTLFSFLLIAIGCGVIGGLIIGILSTLICALGECFFLIIPILNIDDFVWPSFGESFLCGSVITVAIVLFALAIENNKGNENLSFASLLSLVISIGLFISVVFIVPYFIILIPAAVLMFIFVLAYYR